MGIYGTYARELKESQIEQNIVTENTKVYDKAKWQLQGSKPMKEEDIKKHFDFMFKWLNEKNLLSEEGKESMKYGFDPTSTILSSEEITDEGNRFLFKYYDKYITKTNYKDDKNLLNSYYKEYKNIKESANVNSDIVNEAWLFVSEEAKKIKKKIKEIVNSEFSVYTSKSFKDKFTGAFTGQNQKEFNTAYSKSLQKILQVVPNSKAFGPVQRTRSYSDGYNTYIETYYVYVIYGILNNNIIKICFEIGTKWISYEEYKTNIPINFVKEILNMNPSDADLYIKNSSVYTFNRGSLVKSKDFANRVISKANNMGIPASLDAFKSTVKFN